MKPLLLTLSIVAILLVGGSIVAQMQTCDTIQITLPDMSTRTVEVADTTRERERGLSQRDSLAADSGMLFLFSTSDRYSFWMKDTHIPLDIIWINNNKVVDVAQLQPQSGATIPHYTPQTEADAVLELNHGQAAARGITLGSSITWDKCADL